MNGHFSGVFDDRGPSFETKENLALSESRAFLLPPR
jgi:hypothetical protein